MTIPETPAQIGAELLPCPFCGGPAKLYHRDAGDGWSNTDWVCCENEDCDCQTCLHETPAFAIAAWNRRAPTPASRIREEALREAAAVEEATRYAEILAWAIHQKHFAGTPSGWKPLSGDLIGLLTQIGNMTAGLALIDAPQPLPTPPALRTEQDQSHD